MVPLPVNACLLVVYLQHNSADSACMRYAHRARRYQCCRVTSTGELNSNRLVPSLPDTTIYPNCNIVPTDRLSDRLSHSEHVPLVSHRHPLSSSPARAAIAYLEACTIIRRAQSLRATFVLIAPAASSSAPFPALVARSSQIIANLNSL